MKATYHLTDNARLHAIIMRLEKNEKIPCEHRFIDRKIELDTEDSQDMKIIRFLNTVNVVKAIEVDLSDEDIKTLNVSTRIKGKGGEKKVKKDIVEIVTDKRSYYVKGDYEVVQTDLIKYAGEDGWILFDELTEETDIDRILLRVGSIIAIHKLHEWSEES